MPDFVHLHVHSDFSLLDGACQTKSIAAGAAKQKMRAVALTDHGSLFGVVNFYQKALDAGVKPILGYEAYVAPGDRREREARNAGDAATHLTLLAMDSAGYANLIKLASFAYLDGFYYKPRIDKALLEQHANGILCLSGCSSSEICRHLQNNDYAGARQVAEFYRAVFGPERFYIEIQDNGLDVQKRCLQGLAQLGKELGLKVVATNDVHYMTAEDAPAHEVLLCINTATTLSADGRLRLGTNEFYFKSGKEMQERFAWIPEAVTNTLAIAEKCNVEIPFDQRHFPNFVPDDGKAPNVKLRELCEAGLRERYANVTPSTHSTSSGQASSGQAKELRDRLDHELGIIERMSYVSYFLIVWDIMRFARERRIPHSLRGSGAGSLVSYALYISDIEPISQELLFERFLDPRRKEAPDLDLDFCAVRREEVINYVKTRYGEDHTAQIISFGTLAARGVVRDVGRVLDIPLSEVDQINRLIPMGPNVKLKESVEKDPELRQKYENDPRIRKLIDISLRLEGLARHASTHAAGIVLADKPLIEYIPLYKANGVITSQLEMGDLDKVGMLKIDLLGLRELTIVDKTLDLVEQRLGTRPDLDALPLDDDATYKFLATGDTRSVFQLGSEGMQELLHRMEPRTLNDVTAVVGLYRPGPLQAGVVDQYIDRKHGREEIIYLHPSLEPILKSTYGLIVYQEQIMRLCHQVAGMDLGDALTLIKAISKKQDSVIQQRRERFLTGAVAHGLKRELAKDIFDVISKFAQYGFNKAHTAAYAYLAYKTAYLKAHYPVELLAAAMTCEMEYSDKIAGHREECRVMGIEIRPPSLNDSEVDFTVDGEKAIRFGLGAVRNAGQKAMEEIVRARKKRGPFESLHQFCEEVDLHKVNRQAIDSLIKAGAFDGLPGNRAQKVAALDDAMRIGGRSQRDKKAGQATFFGALNNDAAPKHMLPDVAEWPRLQLLTHEKEAVGYYLSGHPLDSDAMLLRKLATVNSASLANVSDGARVVIGGMIKDLRQTFDKRGQSMALFEIEDLQGSARCVLFASVYEKFGRFLATQARVFVVGRADTRMEKPSVRAEEIVPMSDAIRRFCEAVCVKVNGQQEREALLQKLRATIASHPGECPVWIDVPCGNGEIATIKVSHDMYVSATEQFVSEVESLLGKGSLEFVAARNGNHVARSASVMRVRDESENNL